MKSEATSLDLIKINSLMVYRKKNISAKILWRQHLKMEKKRAIIEEENISNLLSIKGKKHDIIYIYI